MGRREKKKKRVRIVKEHREVEGWEESGYGSGVQPHRGGSWLRKRESLHRREKERTDRKKSVRKVTGERRRRKGERENSETKRPQKGEEEPSHFGRIGFEN